MMPFLLKILRRLGIQYQNFDILFFIFYLSRPKNSKIWEGVRICLDANSITKSNFKLFVFLKNFRKKILSKFR